ncbi:hypothetical protein BKP30_27785 [Rhodococcus erythropolis]|nr:hypothetical protein BKP30_27785 [Rhodococcus erythropolis]
MATVAGTGAVDASDSLATVMFFVNQSTTSAAHPEPTLSPSRARVTVERIDGCWLISGLEPM